jgi:hypothetical protein
MLSVSRTESGGRKNVQKYDPDTNPDTADWLTLDEGMRIASVTEYHRRARVRLQNVRLHATIHVIVENQLALGEPVVLETLARLQREGLSRHDVVHAIGSVLAEHIYELLKGQRAPGAADPHGAYFEGLKTLTAASWLESGREDL